MTMAIGIDDEFDDDYEDDLSYESSEDSSDGYVEQNQDVDLISELLLDKGISDTSRIKFENDEGEIEEKDWSELDPETQINILKSSNGEAIEQQNFTDHEVQLLNAIRESGMSPVEYLQTVARNSVNQFVNSNSTPRYLVDDIDDDTLYVADLIARMGDDNVNNEELEHLLVTAKLNPELYNKQVQAIRQEYKSKEDLNRFQEYQYQRQNLIERYNAYAERLEHEIRNLREVGGFDIDMNESEMEQVYNFLVGVDGAGTNYFNKAMSDPQLRTKAAWFLLYGDLAMQDINDYWRNEITRRSRTPKSNVVINRRNKSNKSSFDLDDDF